MQGLPGIETAKKPKLDCGMSTVKRTAGPQGVKCVSGQRPQAMGRWAVGLLLAKPLSCKQNQSRQAISQFGQTMFNDRLLFAALLAHRILQKQFIQCRYLTTAQRAWKYM